MRTNHPFRDNTLLSKKPQQNLDTPSHPVALLKIALCGCLKKCISHRYWLRQLFKWTILIARLTIFPVNAPVIAGVTWYFHNFGVMMPGWHREGQLEVRRQACDVSDIRLVAGGRASNEGSWEFTITEKAPTRTLLRHYAKPTHCDCTFW